jgi:hypothetical protein
MTVDPNREGSPLCMEVCTEKEALALDAAAKRARMAQKAREAPTVADAINQTGGDLRLNDVRSGGRRSAAMASATAPAGPPVAAKPNPELDELKKMISEQGAQLEEVKKSADESAAASQAVIDKQDEELEELRDELVSLKAAAAKAEDKAEKPAKKPSKATGKKRGPKPKKR